jgi:hypothetical protein
MKRRVLIAVGVVMTLAAAVSIVRANVQPYGEITSPAKGETVFGLASLDASYADDDPEGVRWAVRYGTCAASGETVFGNVRGHNDPYSWDGASFHATADTSTWTPGHYCFVLNPEEGAGEQNVRLARRFGVVDRRVSGLGQIVEEVEDQGRKDWRVISFGGTAGSAGASGFVGQMQINLHNVGPDMYDKATFHTTSINTVNFYTDGCIAMNFSAEGLFNGTPGYRIIFRAQDAGEPGRLDSVRIQLFDETGEIYDTFPDEFTPVSDCHGNARTMLDHGNLQIAMR